MGTLFITRDGHPESNCALWGCRPEWKGSYWQREENGGYAIATLSPVMLESAGVSVRPGECVQFQLVDEEPESPACNKLAVVADLAEKFSKLSDEQAALVCRILGAIPV